MKPRETAKTKLIRLVFFVSNVLTLGLGIGLCYLGGSQQVDPEARERAANKTQALLADMLLENSTLAGALASAAPYSWMLWCGIIIVVESLLGMLGAVRTQKHRDRRRGVLLLYHAVLVLTASSCIWLTIMCFFFASQADEYVDRYWVYIQAAFPEDVSEVEAIAMIDQNLTSVAVIGIITGILLIVGLYCSAHLVGHRYLTRSILMWMNGISIMAGAVLATSGLVVANEGLGGELLAYIVAALGGFSVVAGILGTHGARGENTWTLLLYFLLMCAIICGIGAAGIYLLYNAKPDYIRSNWGIVEEKVYPMKYDEAIEVASLHFTELGAFATIFATILLMNAGSACYLRARIMKEGRFFEPFASDMQDSEWDEEDEDTVTGRPDNRRKSKAP